MKRLFQALISGAILISFLGPVSAEEPQSPELKVLNRFVGTWQGKTILTDADGKESTAEDTAVMNWTLGNYYLEDKIGDTLYGLWIYDRDEQVYRCWYFPAGSHRPLISTMNWNEDAATFTGTADLGNGTTMTSHHKFIGNDRYEWTAVLRDAQGATLMKYNGTKIRK